MRSVADRFVDARLLVSDRDPATREPTIEVAHEALLDRWPRLAGWIHEDERWLVHLQHLSERCSGVGCGWPSRRRALPRGPLEAAIEAVDCDGREVSDLEREFIDAGRQARDGEIVAVRRNERRLRRRLTAVAIALGPRPDPAGTRALLERSDAPTPDALPRSRRSSVASSRCGQPNATRQPCSRSRPSGSTTRRAPGRRCSAHSPATRGSSTPTGSRGTEERAASCCPTARPPSSPTRAGGSTPTTSTRARWVPLCRRSVRVTRSPCWSHRPMARRSRWHRGQTQGSGRRRSA